MSSNWPLLILNLTLCAPCFASGIQADTARLAEHLRRFRGYELHEMQAVEFNSIQSEYLAWIDSRMKKGASVVKMNAELADGHLLSDGPQTVDNMFDRSYAGFLGGLERTPVRSEERLVRNHIWHPHGWLLQL